MTSRPPGGEDAGLVAVEYLRITAIVIALLTAILLFFPDTFEGLAAALDGVATEIFGLRI